MQDFLLTFILILDSRIVNKLTKRKWGFYDEENFKKINRTIKNCLLYEKRT